MWKIDISNVEDVDDDDDDDDDDYDDDDYDDDDDIIQYCNFTFDFTFPLWVAPGVNGNC